MSGTASSITAAFTGTLGDFELDVAFSAPMRGITALFGPSGCGKTSILRCAAGLQRLAGHLEVGGEPWQDDARGLFRRTHERPIGYVFQEASLFPHLSVRGNLGYGARRAARRNGTPSVPGFDEVVALLGIEHLLGRAPVALSGGERQRVAVGRALLAQPRLLLMDEPLAALDRAARDELLPYFEMLHRELSIPMLYVSHDLPEVERLADTLLLIERGRVRACGPLARLEADPGLSLMRAPDAAVVVEARISEFDDAWSLTRLTIPGGTLLVPGRRGRIGATRRLRINASDVSFVLKRPRHSSILNCLPARVVAVTAHGEDRAQVNLVVQFGTDGAGSRVVGRITRKSLAAMDLAPGVTLFAQIKSVALLSG